jgi:cytoskeletal protein RodZ
MNEEQKNIFDELKRIRLEKKITLKQISQSTRIQLKYLESLEKGNLLEIPEIYDKLFFKSYIKYLNIPESEYYDQFLEFRKTIRDDRTAILDMTQTESSVEHEFNYKNLLYFVPILMAILIIWFLISNTLIIEDEKTESIKEVSVLEVAERIQSKIDSVKLSETQVQEDSLLFNKSTLLNLSISALQRTWFRVIVDERDTSEYLLQRGQNVSFSSEKCFDFLIGKANGLKMTLNNIPYGPFGIEGQIVKYMRIDSSGVSKKILGYPMIKTKDEDESI